MGMLLLNGSTDFNPRTLFSNNEQGLWLDPSDFSTMWQDSAKTTPVTAAGDRVGYISDKSGRGNDAYQTTLASRPTLARIPSSGRRNLLTYSEQFDNAAWTKTNITASANTSGTTDPIGTNTASKILETTATGTHSIRITATVTSGQNITFSFYAKAAGRNFVRFWEDVNTGKQGYFDLANGTATNSDFSSIAIQSVGNGWYRCSGTINSFAGTSYGFRVHVSTDGTTTSYAGDDTKGVYLWGAQLETGSTATSYQKVVATTDVTESGVSDLWHLVFDGSDDSLVTNAVDFSVTDEMTVIAGVRKLSDAARGTICELTATIASNNGAFHLTAPNAASATYAFESKGTALTDAVASSVTAPITSVVSGASDISGDANVIRVNGTQYDSDTGDQGTGNYSNSAIFIGRRNQATLPFTGHIYQLIVRGKTTPTGKLLEAEQYTARKAGTALVVSSAPPPSGGDSAELAYHLVFYGDIRFEAIALNVQQIILEVL